MSSNYHYANRKRNFIIKPATIINLFFQIFFLNTFTIISKMLKDLGNIKHRKIRFDDL